MNLSCVFFLPNKDQHHYLQLIRDWSVECVEERNSCYGLVISSIMNEFGQKNPRSNTKVLVPGSGLCRLAFDIANLGFMCQANEFSFSMLLTANYILNRNVGAQSHKIYPWALQFNNNFKTEDQLVSYLIPDIDTSLPGANLSMCAGDFLEIYKERDMWDCVATCFFVDTARNIVKYVDVIYNILKPGGVWVNMGPLLYHYSDMPNESSIELSYEQLKSVIQNIGFLIEEEKYPMSVAYVDNPRSMLRYTYQCVFFKARKGIITAS